jgi:hypothetical protein
MFSGAIERVSDTKILVSTVYPAKIVNKKIGKTLKKLKVPIDQHFPLQLVVYSNRVSLLKNGPRTSMILPFPLREGKNRVKILNLQYNKLFEELDMIFPFVNTLELVGKSEKLMINQIGSYETTIIPNFKSFGDFNFERFHLSPSIVSKLETYYKIGYGFVACMLRRDAKYHPFAYVHELRTDRKFFIPTRRYHGFDLEYYSGQRLQINPYGRYHDQDDETDFMTDEMKVERMSNMNNHYHSVLMEDDSYLTQKVKRTNLQDTRVKAEVYWDHQIYILNISLSRLKRFITKEGSAVQGVTISEASTDKLQNFKVYVDVKKLPHAIILPYIKKAFKLSIREGYTANHDLFI